MTTSSPERIRLFLDTGVIVQGLYSHWGASKGVLILATSRRSYTVVLTAAVEQELQRNVTGAAAVDLLGWLSRVRVERGAMPPFEVVRGYEPVLLPALRHTNDLVAVVSAIQAQPDWVISANSAHWGQALARRTGLRIVTPQEFIGRLRPI